jgi:hypothetical protein
MKLRKVVWIQFLGSPTLKERIENKSAKIPNKEVRHEGTHL